MYKRTYNIKLSREGIGFSVDVVFINNITYADDMGVTKPIHKCFENYAKEHGLMYNTKKSEFIFFQSKTQQMNYLSPIKLRGAVLKRVSQSRYLWQ